MKKHYLLALLFTFFNTIAFSQVVKFEYDDAGNRVKRQVISLRIGKTKQDSIVDKSGGYNFTFYPNPTVGQVTVKMEPTFIKEENKKAFLYDMNGKLLQEKEVTSNIMQFDLTPYPFGFYILKVLAKGYSAEWKVVKQ